MADPGTRLGVALSWRAFRRRRHELDQQMRQLDAKLNRLRDRIEALETALWLEDNEPQLWLLRDLCHEAARGIAETIWQLRVTKQSQPTE